MMLGGEAGIILLKLVNHIEKYFSYIDLSSFLQTYEGCSNCHATPHDESAWVVPLEIIFLFFTLIFFSQFFVFFSRKKVS